MMLAQMLATLSVSNKNLRRLGSEAEAMNCVICAGSESGPFVTMLVVT